MFSPLYAAFRKTAEESKEPRKREYFERFAVWQDLTQLHYESPALTTELRARKLQIVNKLQPMRLKRTRPASNGKTEKPYAEYPLFAHESGRWCKKVRGRHVYFGPLSDPTAALHHVSRLTPIIHGKMLQQRTKEPPP
jgi:hypothetical protein